MQRLLKKKNSQKQILTVACALLCCGMFSFAYATADSTSIGAPNMLPGPSGVIGTGSGYVPPNTNNNFLGFTSMTAGLCQAPLTVKVVGSLSSIDDAGASCYDKWLNMNIRAVPAKNAGKDVYQILGGGQFNTTGGCGSPGNYLGFRITWVATCE